VRGVPWIAPILEPLKQIGKWSDAELNAAVVSSLWVVFMEMDAEAFRNSSTTTAHEGHQRCAEVVRQDRIRQGCEPAARREGRDEDAGPAEPAVRSVLPGDVRAAGHGARHAQGGAADALPEQLHRGARGVHDGVAPLEQRRDKVAKTFCQPVFELWLAQEVSAAASACPGFFASKRIRAAWCAATWTGDGPAPSIR
jgi:capsid protein